MTHYNTKKFISVLLTAICLLSLIFSATSCSSKTVSTIETTAKVTEEIKTEEVTTVEPTTEEPTTLAPTTKKPTEKPTQKPTKKPTEKPTDPPIVLEITGVSSVVSPGEYAYVSIQGKPNTDYSITVTYKSGASTAEGLYTKTSDGNGNVSWEWKVGTRTSSGTYPIRISGGGQSVSCEFTVL